MEQHQTRRPPVPRECSMRQSGRKGLQDTGQTPMVRRGRQGATPRAGTGRGSHMDSKRPALWGRRQAANHRKELLSLAMPTWEIRLYRPRRKIRARRQSIDWSYHAGLEAPEWQRIWDGGQRNTTKASQHNARNKQNSQKHERGARLPQHPTRLRVETDNVPEVLWPCLRERIPRQQAPCEMGMPIQRLHSHTGRNHGKVGWKNHTNLCSCFA